MKKMIYIGYGPVHGFDPPKGALVEVYNHCNLLGITMVQIKCYERIPGSDAGCYYRLDAFREPLEGEEIVNDLAYKTLWEQDKKYVDLQKQALKRESFRRELEKFNQKKG